MNKTDLTKFDFESFDLNGDEYEIFTRDNLDWISKNVKKINGIFKVDSTNFYKFRDIYLTSFTHYDVYSIDGVDIKWDLFNSHFIEYYDYVRVTIINDVPLQLFNITIDWGAFNYNDTFKNHLICDIFINDIYQKFFKVEVGDIVVDVGASIGPFTYKILEQHPKHVYCLEPHPEIFKTLQKNLPNSNVTLINKGIVESSGETNFDFLAKTENVNELYSPSDDIWCEPGNAVGIKFSTFIKENKITQIDFLKTDCEGGEYDIFNDENFDWISKNIKKISGEFHVVNDDQKRKFKKFRDTYLSTVNSYEVYNTLGECINKEVWDDTLIDKIGWFYLYINNSPTVIKKDKMIDNFSKNVIENGGSLHPLIVPAEFTNKFGLCNPSILIENNEVLINIRNTHYTLHCNEGEKKYYSAWSGPLQYLNPENSPYLTTVNFMGKYDMENNKLVDIHKIDTSKLDVPTKWEFIGLEDVRLVRWDDKLYNTGVRRDTTTNGVGRMELSEIVDYTEITRQRIEIPKPELNSYCEKNWMPILDMPYHYVKWTNPLEIVKVNPKDGSSEITIHHSEPCNLIHQNFRGNSQVIRIGEYRMALVHEVFFPYNPQNFKDADYIHKIIVWDLDWNVVSVSDLFNFMNGRIEFSCGMAATENEVLIPYGFQDNASYMLRIPIDFFKKFVNIPTKEEKTSISDNKLDGFPSAYSVSLPDSMKRRRDMSAQFRKYNVSHYMFSEAYDGRVIDYCNHELVKGHYLDSVNSGGIATAMSHLNAIRHWYENTDDKIGFFCEDDIKLTNCENWEFNWKDVEKQLPFGWDCIQLSLIRSVEQPMNNSVMRIRRREWFDWACGSYLITRKYAKWLIDTYIKNGVYEFYPEYGGTDIYPYVENIIYLHNSPNIYTLPLFVENVEVISTFYPDFIDSEQKKNQYESSKFVEDWYIKNKENQLNTLLGRNIEVEEIETEFEEVKESVKITKTSKIGTNTSITNPLYMNGNINILKI